MSPKRTRRRYTAEFKAEVVLAALTERQPLAELAAHYQLAPAQISRWKLHLRQQAAQVFAEAPKPAAAAPDVEPLYATIDRLQMEITLLKKRWGHVSSPATRAGYPGRPGQFGAGSLPGVGALAQQLLLPARRGKRL
jgi:transposase-like protein